MVVGFTTESTENTEKEQKGRRRKEEEEERTRGAAGDSARHPPCSGPVSAPFALLASPLLLFSPCPPW
jgi:hypothetical protein